MSDATAKLCSIRHHCFVRGILGQRNRKNDQPPEDDFRQAFRTVNRLYVQARHNIALKRQVYPHTDLAGKRREAA